MTSELWQAVGAVFEAALQYEGPERVAFVERSCSANPALQQQVESLLKLHREDGFLELPAFRLPKAFFDGAEPRQVGPYRLIRQLGAGGMGTVYLAERDDGEYRKQVAIKLINGGADRDLLLQRFQTERQILAVLEHPNIARLLDGGTTAGGDPFLVMDYVAGEPIDAYCNRCKLNLAERLTLFRQVCSAVQYAHQNLIVHRDLKPSNILVTDEGVPKLLDFGIGKFLALPSQQTTWLAMTPGYASPEQLRGRPITTATDIYSLGVLLYELLTGELPYQLENTSAGEMERLICEQVPVLPSLSVLRQKNGGPHEKRATAGVGLPEQLPRALAGDLDTILMMALRKEPERRYSSVAELAEDLRRYQVGLPVSAQPDTLRYRARKFLQRHRLGVGAAALVLVTLVGGIVATSWQAQIAQRRFNDVRRLTNSFLFEFHDAIENLPGSTPARALVVKKALEYLDLLAREATHDRQLQQELAIAYQKVGKVQGNPAYANLGDIAGASASYSKAEAIFKALVNANPGERRLRRNLANFYFDRADLNQQMANIAGAVVDVRAMLALGESLAAEPDDPDRFILFVDAHHRHLLASAHEFLGDILFSCKDPTALAHYRVERSISKALLAADPKNVLAHRNLGTASWRIGRVLLAEGRASEGLAYYREVFAIAEAQLAGNPASTQARSDFAFMLDKLGDGLVVVGKPEQARQAYQKALALRRELARRDPQDALARRYLADSLVQLAKLQSAHGEYTTAQANFKQAVALYERLAAIDPSNAVVREALAQVKASLRF